ncbi:MAG: hypothetical protein E7384_01970 [Ruminococcaceae bacterium]|nr:hypothetical protein [Oscillospiraceae bacterium]
MKEEKKNNVALKIAKIVRVSSVPPVMVTILIILLYFLREGIFRSWIDGVVSIMSLAVIPVLAYPISWIIPKLRAKGREGQRNLAFALNPVGYIIAFAYGLISRAGKDLMIIYTAYLLSVIVLLLFNKVLKFRASGHACAVTGPIVIISYYLGMWGIVGGAVVYALILWASLAMKRHTLKEFVFGSLTSATAFFIGVLVFGLI